MLTIHPEDEVPVKSVTIRRIPRYCCYTEHWCLIPKFLSCLKCLKWYVKFYLVLPLDSSHYSHMFQFSDHLGISTRTSIWPLLLRFWDLKLIKGINSLVFVNVPAHMGRMCPCISSKFAILVWFGILLHFLSWTFL